MTKREHVGRRIARVGVPVLLLVLAIGACSRSSGSVQTDRNLITATELHGLPSSTTLLQAIQRLRPQWLRGRGPQSITGSEPVIVYLNASRTAGEILSQLRSEEVRQLQFLDAINATQRFGTGHRSGAILITSM